jgi:hypothetical protein
MMKQMMLVVSSVVLCGIGGLGCATDGTSGDSAQTSETSADSTECWPVAGLYFNPCDTSQSNLREDIHNGEQVDIIGPGTLCGNETWAHAVHHATGHQGWVRGPSLCP